MMKASILNIKNKNRLFLLPSIIFLILSFIFIIITPKANGFEKSVYHGFPTIFWILFTLSIIFGFAYIYMGAITNFNRNYLALAIIVFLLAYFTYFLLPYIRGYALFDSIMADFLAHVGYTKTILETNHIGDNWYPISHILMAQFNMMNISFELSRIMITFFFTIQYIIFTVLYLRELERKIKNIIILFCALPLLYSAFHVSFQPALMSFFTIPLLLYLFEKNKNLEKINKFYVLFFILALFLVFFHPATTIILIMIFTVFLISVILYDLDIYKDYSKSTYLSIISILFTSFYVWYFQFSRMEGIVRTRIQGILFGAHETLGMRYTERFAESELPLINRIITFFEAWGNIFIYGSIALLFLLGFIRVYLSKRDITYPEFSISLQYIGGIAFGGINLITILVGGNIIRQGRWAIFFSTLIVGYGLNKKIKSTEKLKDKKNLNKNHIALFVIFLLITAALILPLYNIYDGNNPLTYSQEHGSDWYIENANYSEKESVASGLSYKIVRYHRGHHTSIERGDFFGRADFRHPHRLGYLENNTAAETFNQNVYIITKPHDYNRHEDWHPARLEVEDYYLEEDLEKLESDPTVNKLYSNGEFIVWEVNSE